MARPAALGRAPTDIVFLDALQLTTSIGLDCWGRPRPQPVLASVYLHLEPSFLDTCGRSDDVEDSVNYGHLAKRVSSAVGKRAACAPYPSVRALVEDIAGAAFQLAGATAAAVRVVVDLPKQILLASGFSLEITTPRPAAVRAGSEVGEVEGQQGKRLLTADSPALVRVKDLDLAVLIGVNPPERLARQRVVTNITFFELPPSSPSPRLPASFISQMSHDTPSDVVNYPSIVGSLFEKINTSSFETLEKLVHELIYACVSASPRIEAATVRCEKPSAIASARTSGVEMTRWRRLLVSRETPV